MNNLIDKSRHLPVREHVQTISIAPVMLEAPFRGRPLQVRITAPVVGEALPVILLSHGDGPSLYLPSRDGYALLADFYAGQGFVVIQPSHANSQVAGLPRDAEGAPLFWRMRVLEMKLILDRLQDVERLAAGLSGRLDHERVAAVGHSLGGQTVGMLLGARLSVAGDAALQDVSVIEPRIKAGVLLTPPGRGGEDLSAFARENFPELNADYSHLTTRSLVVVGDEDVNPYITVRGPEWYRAAFEDGTGCEALLTVKGGKHGLGGIAGWDAKETGDEDPDRLATVQRMTAAYLRSALYEGECCWVDACAALSGDASSLASVELKTSPAR